MKLANKYCYPVSNSDNIPTVESKFDLNFLGLTFKERLIIALASNPQFVDTMNYNHTAYNILCQANAIIKELEKEND